MHRLSPIIRYIIRFNLPIRPTFAAHRARCGYPPSAATQRLRAKITRSPESGTHARRDLPVLAHTLCIARRSRSQCACRKRVGTLTSSREGRIGTCVLHGCRGNIHGIHRPRNQPTPNMSRSERICLPEVAVHATAQSRRGAKGCSRYGSAG
jgi:hypothetical protein